MSFNEKLQYLRKENKLSQEQLADMLDVTRQSVSKWESGTTYPEMDKLIMLCKIFKCSLDDLTNDEVTDLDKVNKRTTNNNIMSNLLDNCLEIINKTVKMFRAMTFKQIVGCVVSLLILGLFLAIMRIPFEALEHGIYSVLRNIGRPAIVGFLSGLFNLIIDIIYFALYILVFVYIYKIAYLDKYEFVEAPKPHDDENAKSIDKKEIKEQKEQIYEEKISRNADSREYKENTLFKILGGLVVGFVKFLVAFAAIPAVLLLMLFCFLLVINIYLFFEGIVFIGTFIALLFSIILSIWFLELLSIFIFNRKASFRRLLWTFIVSIIGLSMSGGLFVLELSKIEFVDTVPNEIEFVTKDYEYQMKPDFTINNQFYYTHRNEYVVDETMGDKVKIEISSYDDFVTVGVMESLKSYDIVYYDGISSHSKKIIELIKDSLKHDKIYNYDKLRYAEVKVIANSKNIETIKANTIKLIEEERSRENICYYDNYEVRISNYEDELDELWDENADLREQIRELEDYKNRVQDIIGE